MTRWQQVALVCWTLLALALAVAPTVLGGEHAAAPAGSTKTLSDVDIKKLLFADLINTIKTAKKSGNEADAENALDQTVNPFMSWTAGVSTLRSEVQNWRVDVQTESPTSSAGTTSLVSKGSVPSLLGLAVENGALTQSASGTSITFRTNPTGLIKALQKYGYADSGPNSYQDPVTRFVSKASAAVTFNTSGTNSGSQPATFTGSSRQISNVDFRYDIINHRDPRDKKYNAKWGALRAGQLHELSNAAVAFAGQLKGIKPEDPDRAKKYQQWLASAQARVAKADANADDSASNSVQTVVFAIADDFANTFGSDPAIKSLASTGSQALSAYLKEGTKIRDLISKSPILTFEYTGTRQGTMTTAMAMASASATTAMPASKLPDLSNLKLIIAGGTVGATTLTANASLTLFNENPQAPDKGRIRDFQLSGEADIPLREIQSLGVPTLTFAALFLSLRRQPLGMPVQVNGVNVDLKGNIGFAQAKISLPVKKGSGVNIPLSITYASRTELNKEHDIRGSIGMTLNLDSLFASTKP
jgi:hypothetical protein